MTAKPRYRPPTAKKMKRTGTAKYGPKKNRKTDPVARYQQMQNSWNSSKFLKKSGTKQGRKLDLEGFNQWKKIVQDSNKPVKQSRKIYAKKKAPTEKRRDNLRFNLRAKMSQEDYCDRDLKYFHYNNRETPDPLDEMPGQLYEIEG